MIIPDDLASKQSANQIPDGFWLGKTGQEKLARCET